MDWSKGIDLWFIGDSSYLAESIQVILSLGNILNFIESYLLRIVIDPDRPIHVIDLEIYDTQQTR